MSTKIIFTRTSPGCLILSDDATGKELYRIETCRRFVGGFTKVYRYETATSPASNPTPRSYSDVDEPYNDYNPDQERAILGRGREGSDKSDAFGARGEASGDDSPEHPLENEIARLYWKWFSSTRMVFEGKIRRRAQYMPHGDGLRLSFVFSHKDVSYRWVLGQNKIRAKLVTNDPSRTLIASFYPKILFKRTKTYMKVTPAGMDMLDHIIVTYLPVEARRQEM